MTPLVEKYRPMKLEDFAGLARPKAILSQLVREPYPSAWLLLGPSGLGKTTMALAVAEAIAGDVHHIPSRKCDLETVDQVVHGCWYVPMRGQWHVVLVDEADQMSQAAQLAFLSKLDTTAAPPNTIFIFTANDTALLKDRFLSRCRTIKFDGSDVLEPGAQLLERIWRAESSKPCPPAAYFTDLLTTANLNVRQAIMELEVDLIAGPAPQLPKPAAPVVKPVMARRRVTPKSVPVPAGELLDAYAVAEFFKIDRSTLYNRVKSGRVPQPDRTGNKWIWTRSQIEAAA